MRPLTEEETKTFFTKLSEFIGKSIEKLINRSDERHCFRLSNVRILDKTKDISSWESPFVLVSSKVKRSKILLSFLNAIPNNRIVCII